MTAFFSAFSSSKLEKYPKKRGWSEKCYTFPYIRIQVQSALSRLIKDKTVLIIAHRMRTVAGADRIVVLSDGVVAEQGNPDELYNKNGIYTRMVDLHSASGKRKIKLAD